MHGNEGFPSATPLIPFQHRVSNVKSFSFMLDASKDAFDPLIHNKTKQFVRHPFNLYLIL